MEKYHLDPGKGMEFGLYTLGDHIPNPATGERISAQQRIQDKILYQHELFVHQRYIAQMDFGGVPFAQLRNNIEWIGTEILPAIKKYTAKG